MCFVGIILKSGFGIYINEQKNNNINCFIWQPLMNFFFLECLIGRTLKELFTTVIKWKASEMAERTYYLLRIISFLCSMHLLIHGPRLCLDHCILSVFCFSFGLSKKKRKKKKRDNTTVRLLVCSFKIPFSLEVGWNLKATLTILAWHALV